MSRFLVSYDLRKQGQDYRSVWTYLRNLSGKKVLESLWLVETTKSRKELFDSIRNSSGLDSNDGLVVIEYTWYTYINTLE